MDKRLFLALSLCVATAAIAQQPPKHTSSIIGIALDSLHRRPLAGAEVMLDVVNRTTTTDSLGRFRLDSLPAGRYQLGVFHPILDSLGISLATPPFVLGADSTSIIRVAIPSSATLIARTCKARLRPLGNAAIFGRLLDPETEQPVPGADVSIVWTEIEVSKEIGVRRTPRLVRDSTDANGVFRLCGLPSELDARLQANYHGAITADVPMSIQPYDGDFVTRTLFVSPSDTGAAKTGKAIISGKVTLAGGAPPGGTRVEIAGSPAVTLTNDKGEFTLSNAPSGTQLLVVRRLGYTASEMPVNLSSRQPQQVALKLEKFIPMMDPVVVTARRDRALQSVGFTQRQKSGMGRYITGDEIARRNPIYLTDVLRTVPGLRVDYSGGQPTISSSRGVGLSSGCVAYVVDGFRWQSMQPGDTNDFVNPREVAAIEVYQASETPPEFSNAGQSCTTIVIWTKSKVGAQ